MFVCILSAGDISLNWLEKQISSGVRFHVRPATAVISAPRRQIKSKTDKTPRFILVKKKTLWCLKRRGKPCKVHETHFPSLKNLWKVYKQAGRKSLEYIRLLIWDVDSVTRVVRTPWQNFRIKHLDGVLHFKWKVCRKISCNHGHTLIKIKCW